MARINNCVTLIGNITKEIEYRHIGESALANFTVAVNRPKGKNGDEQTDFIRCTAWGKTADIVNQYLSKGHKVAVLGELNIDVKKDDDGHTRTFASVRVDSVTFADNAPAAGKSKSNSTSHTSGMKAIRAVDAVDDAEDAPWNKG